MFIESKYTKIYFKIIERAKTRSILGYTEKHHITPRSLGGADEKDNIVALTAREHFICHLLLIRMVSGKDEKRKMVYAAWQQSRPSTNKNVKVTGRVYEMLRKQMSETYIGRKRAPFSKEWRDSMSKRAIGEKNNMYGKSHTEETKLKISQNRAGKATGSDNPFYGKTHTDEVKAKIREVNGRETTCPHCGKSGASNVMKRWHFDNCKFKQS